MKKIILPMLTALALIFSVNAFASSPTGKQKNPLNLKEGNYEPGTIIVKMKSHTRTHCRVDGIDVNSFSQKLLKIGATSVSKMYPRAAVPSVMRTFAGQQLIDISLMYKIHFSGNINLVDALNLLNADENIEYAEPNYIARILYTPNEPSGNLSLQYFLTKIQAFTAWDIWKGDTNTVIGIVDSGTDWDHPDLAANIKLNYADPINGIDDDLDGFVDNFRGWDVSDNDNDPMVGNEPHGSHVSGCAAAVTDNGTGVASPGFRCKFLPVKSALSSTSGFIQNGYDGIVYAADHGVNVINCSWGGGGFSQFQQDIMNYAAVNHNVTICCSAGNGAVEEESFPASYDNVISVASTDQGDIKSGFSSYGFKVDVCAPGTSIYSTVSNDGYTFMDGTSMASPIAAGAAAMIKSKNPGFTYRQVAAQLKSTCDNIYGVNAASLANRLGQGRINMYRALSDTTARGIEVTNMNIVDGNDDVFIINDTLDITALFTDLLRPCSNLIVTLTAQSTHVTVLSNTFNAGALATNDTISNFSAHFRVRVRPTAVTNDVIPFRLAMVDGAYTTYHYFGITVNVDYLNIHVNDIGTTATSNGRIGYNLVGSAGLGFTYQGSISNLYEASLMIGDGSHSVADGVRGATAGQTDADFFDVNKIVQIDPSTIADWYSYGTISDASAPVPMNVLIKHNEYAWIDPPNQGYVIFEYVIKNNGAPTINNLYAGIFADFDVNNFAQTVHYDNNRDTVDVARRMGYVYNTEPDGFYCGIKLLTHDTFHHYGIDNDTVGGGGGGGISLSAGFSEADKYTSLSTDRPSAGRATTNPGGNDVCDVTSTGPFTILAGDSITVAFALVSGLQLDVIEASADAAQLKYDSLSVGLIEIPLVQKTFSLEQNYPNPVINQTNIKFSLSETNNTELALFNAMGQKVKTLLSDKLNAGSFSMNVDLTAVQGGVYYLKLTSGTHSQIRPMTITH